MKKNWICMILGLIMLCITPVLALEEDVAALNTEEIAVLSEVSYEITNATELANVANDLSGAYTLKNDIDLSSFGDWTPIGTGTGNGQSFSGIFDGQGHTIRGITMSGSGYSYSGLFGVVTGTVKNLNVEITIVDANTAGGLIGYLNGGTVTTSSSTGSISGQNDIGGLIGYSQNSSIKNCYSMVNVISTSDKESDGCGGLVGDLYGYYNTSSIGCCYATGKVIKTGTSGLGGIVGYKHTSGNGAAPVIASYYDATVSGMTDQQQGFSLTTELMKQRDTYANWDFDHIWGIDSSRNNGYPYLKLTGDYWTFELEGSGTSRDPYIITTEAELAAVARGEITNSFTAYYQLGNNITLSSNYWTPIGGNGMSYFSGEFDGNGYTINGIRIFAQGYSNAGLFGYVSGTVKNLRVEGNIINAACAGLLAGTLDEGTIELCCASGILSGQKDTGGLIGYARNSSISNCYSTVQVSNTSSSEQDGCGDLLGELYGNYNISSVRSSYAKGAVEKSGSNGIGGLVGYRHSNGGSGSASVISCYFDNYNDSSTDKGTYKSADDMKQRSTYSDWDFDTVWGISGTVNEGYPYLRIFALQPSTDPTPTPTPPTPTPTPSDITPTPTPEPSETSYRINSITIQNSDTAEIPAGKFLATVSVTKLNEAEDTMVMLASYTANGQFVGELMFVRVEDMTAGSTFYITVPVDNTAGRIARLKAFVVNSFSNFTPLGDAVNFPS